MSLFTIIFLIIIFRLLFQHEDNYSETTHRTNNGRRTYQGNYSGRPRTDFVEALLVLIAAIMKADGQVKKVELDYVKSILLTNLGEARAKEALLRLRDILKLDIDINSICLQIRYSLDYSTRLQIVHILFGVAKADSIVTPEEKNLVSQIGYAIGLSVADIESLFGTYQTFTKNNLDDAYKVLEITSNATDDEIKKAYRNMAKKYHPDTVAELGEEAQKAAEAKFRKVAEAYEKIKEARGIK